MPCWSLVSRSASSAAATSHRSWVMASPWRSCPPRSNPARPSRSRCGAAPPGLRSSPSRPRRRKAELGHFVPHTDDEIRSMLEFIGLSSLDELFAAVPEALRLSRGLEVAPGLSEPDVLAEMDRLARSNTPCGRDLVCFAGGGAYDHDVPSVVRRVAFRSEFVTAYTPYQPEVAQGVLQALFEYQTMISRLTGLPIANASLYDGATACVEAVNLAAAVARRQTIWVSRGVNPLWRDTLRTFAAGTAHVLTDVPLTDGRTAWPSAIP